MSVPIPWTAGKLAMVHFLRLRERWRILAYLKRCLLAGGIGTRNEVGNEELLAFIKKHASFKHLPSTVLTVCTGAALAAKAGLLKGMRATTNKVCCKLLENGAELCMHF